MADHLFYPDVPQKPLRIEYDGPLYDGGDWHTFPHRSGWLDEAHAITFPADAVPPEYRSRMHCWIYFGVLHYVFGDRLDQSDFLLHGDEGGEQQYITTRQLEKYVGDADDWESNDRGARCMEVIPKVLDSLANYSRWIDGEMSIAARLVALALWNVATKRGSPQPTLRNPGLFFLSYKEDETLIRDGWCPVDVARCIRAGMQLDTQVYLMQLARPKPSWYKRTHDACEKTECKADNIDESTYVTRHVQEDCNCLHVGADVDQLHAILHDGRIPVVKITPCGEDELGKRRFTVKVVKKRSSQPYVAVSHVWADGLGNPHANSLPHCQLEFLYDRARPLLREKEYIPHYKEKTLGVLHSRASRIAHFAANATRGGDDSVLVWIDTLCIPHQDDVRSLAIQRIRDVYVGAYRTMIIDSSMMMIDSRACSKLELCLRVLYCSGWVRRLWTLQEALASDEKLYVLLADKPVNVSSINEELVTKVDKGETPILQEGMATIAAGAWYLYFEEANDYTSAFRRMLLESTQGLLVASAWFNVATRASSKDRDRATVLAGVLNLDVKKILEVKEAKERMRTLYGMLEWFPQDVLFLEGPRFEEEGLGWAIQVCRFTGELAPLSHDGGKITPRGLEVSRYASLIYPSCRFWDHDKFLDTDDITQRRKDLNSWLEASGLAPTDPATGIKILHLTTERRLDVSADVTYGILMSESRLDVISRCAVLSLQATEDGVCYGRYVSSGYIKADLLNLRAPKMWGYTIRGTWDDAEKPTWVAG
ncbi:hypothetical protein BJX68DRAFT_234159 [Aspergillus pseudodeflectus]|uniref:Heterokaryon incompatibility domain-containing protein n=1 Tax=Aspergillus pseudodeflectus TaxID=176178 RepID=A0ABR4KLM9_9EURO